jgi:hypothetical protein
VPADAQADLAVDFEAARRRKEAEGRWAQRVCVREDNAAVVDARGVGRGRGGPAQGEVPFEEVCVEGGGVEVGGGVCLEFGGFFDCGNWLVVVTGMGKVAGTDGCV